jgi:hypothetical protein
LSYTDNGTGETGVTVSPVAPYTVYDNSYITSNLGINGNIIHTGSFDQLGNIVSDGNIILNNAGARVLYIDGAAGYGTFDVYGDSNYGEYISAFNLHDRAMGDYESRAFGFLVRCMDAESYKVGLLQRVGAALKSVMEFDTPGNVYIGPTDWATAEARLEVMSTTDQLRLSYNTSNYVKSTVASNGRITYDSVGTLPSFNFADPVSITGSLSTRGSANISGDITCSRILFTGEIWDDMKVDGLSVKTSGLGAMGEGNWSGSALFPTYFFKGGGVSDTNCWMNVQLPHDYKQGTDVLLHIHVSPEVTAAGANTGSLWEVGYHWRNVNQEATTPVTVVSNITGSLNGKKAWQHVILPMCNLTGAGKTASSVIKVNIKRLDNNALDNYPDDIYLDSVDLHYRKDRIGSANEMSQ